MSNAGTITTLTNSGAISGGNGGSGVDRRHGRRGRRGRVERRHDRDADQQRHDQRRKRRRRLLEHGGAGGAGDIEFRRDRTLTNSGTIEGGDGRNWLHASGAAGDAIYSAGAHASIGPITNSGQIIGNVEIDNQASVTVTGGTGKTFGSWTGGTITIGNGNLTFAGGNTALGDDVEVDGGKGTVINKGPLQIATLRASPSPAISPRPPRARSAWTLRATSRDSTARLRSAGARASTAASGST